MSAAPAPEQDEPLGLVWTIFALVALGVLLGMTIMEPLEPGPDDEVRPASPAVYDENGHRILYKGLERKR